MLASLMLVSLSTEKEDDLSGEDRKVYKPQRSSCDHSAMQQAHAQASRLAHWRSAAAAAKSSRARVRALSETLQTLQLARLLAAWRDCVCAQRFARRARLRRSLAAWARRLRSKLERRRRTAHAACALKLSCRARCFTAWQGEAMVRSLNI